jgi:O-antigen/teichoic acid export membrane protein
MNWRVHWSFGRTIEELRLYVAALLTTSRHLPLRHRFASGAVWSVLAAGIAQALGLPLSIITARFLGGEGFGALGVVQGTAATLGIVAGMGLSNTAVKYVAEFRMTDPPRAGRIVGLCVAGSGISAAAIAAVLFFLSPYLAPTLFNASSLVVPLQLGSLLVALSAVNSAQLGILCGLEAFRAMSRTNLWRGLLAMPIVVLGAAIWHLPGTIIGYIVATALGVVINHRVIVQECRIAGLGITYLGWREEKEILWKFSLPALLTALASTPAAWLASAMLAHQPAGYLELGLFNAANQWRSALLFLPNTLGQVVTPMLSSLLALKNNRGSRNVLLASAGTSAAVVVPAALALCLVSNYVMRLYGPAFANHGLTLILVCTTASLVAIQTPVGNLVTASGRMWYGVGMNSVWTIVLLASAWIYLYRGWGANGLAGSYLTAYLIHSIWTAWFAIRTVGKSASESAPEPVAVETVAYETAST